MRPGHKSVRVGDISRRIEDTVKKSRFAPFDAVIIIITTVCFFSLCYTSDVQRASGYYLTPMILPEVMGSLPGLVGRVLMFCDSNKALNICDYTMQANVDVVFLCETWLRPVGDEADCAA